MLKRIVITLSCLFALSACVERTPIVQNTIKLGADGNPLPQAYIIQPSQVDGIQFRTEESINAFRQASGLVPVSLNPELIASAATHSRDMYIQNRPWLFGSDGSSPLERAERAGFTGRLLGEVISETFENELKTLAAWMQQDDTRAIILDARARHIGFAWYQEPSGKIWWTLSVGSELGQIAPQIQEITPLGLPVEGSRFQTEE